MKCYFRTFLFKSFIRKFYFYVTFCTQSMRTKPVTPMLAPEKGAVWSINHKENKENTFRGSVRWLRSHINYFVLCMVVIRVPDYYSLKQSRMTKFGSIQIVNEMSQRLETGNNWVTATGFAKSTKNKTKKQNSMEVVGGWVHRPGAKTINVFRACLGAQLIICAQKWRNFVLFSTVSLRFVLSRVRVFLYSLGPRSPKYWYFGLVYG